MDRLYQTLIEWHCAHDEQMLFLAGPRQAGKTHLSLSLAKLTDQFCYINWDVKADREKIIAGADVVAQYAGLNSLHKQKPIIVFDEIHKYSQWKNLLKGFFDKYKTKAHIIVTGSAKLDIYRRGSDSLMGRYFLYRMHPVSVGEICRVNQQEKAIEQLIYAPCPMDEKQFQALWDFGGFPEPFLKRNKGFHQRWQTARAHRLLHEDIRQLTQIQSIDHMEILIDILKPQIANLINRSNLAKQLGVPVSTIQRWLNTLNHFYYLFMITPWSKNIPRSLIKEPKIFLWDWSQLTDAGQRAENFIACHLHKAAHYWQDIGLGTFSLHFIRDKEKREVDFVIVKDNQPWILIEVKYANNHSISKALYRFQAETQAPHAFQVIIDANYRDIDCFTHTSPIIVPARTLLSQLV